MIALGMASTSLDRLRDTLTSVVAAVSLLLLLPASPSAAATKDPCAGAPATAAAQQAAFGALPRLGGGWSTADGFVPVPLPDGDTAWLMSDTLVAPPAADPAAGPTFVHNSIVLQRGNCFTPVMGGTVAARDDLVAPVDGRACWPSAGVARDSSLVALCTEVEHANGPPGFGFRVVGTTLATLDLPSLTPIGRAPLPFVEPAGIRWGTGAILHRGSVYVYGATADAQYVARVPFDRLVTGPWAFWNGRAWAGRETLQPMVFAGATPAMPAFVTPTDRGFVAVAFSSPFPDPTIDGWTASAPQGPWRRIGTVATATTTPGQYAYDARAVDLGVAGWAIVYNVNDPVAVATDPSVYGGRFVPAPPRFERRLEGGVRERRTGATARASLR
jgi:hypothetical protein